jgi:hypothetical protein
MVFAPDPPYPKSQGDPLLSADWNAAIDEVLRLEGDKVNRAGDTIMGPLTVAGNVGIGTTVTGPGTSLDVYRDEGDDVGGLHLTTSGGRLLKIGVRADASNERAFIDYTRNNIGRPLILQMNGGNVGIGTPTPKARLSVVGPGATEILGTARSSTLLSSAGRLGATTGDELALASIGFATVNNNVSLGIRGHRAADGPDWPTTAIGLGMDVDDTVRAGASLWLHANGNVGIGTTNPPGAKLDVSGSGGATQCCAPIFPTLSLAEGSSVANRQAWLQFHNGGEAEAYIRLAGGGPAGSGREGQRRLEIGNSQGASTELRIVAGALSLPKTTDGYAELTNWRGFGGLQQDNPQGALRLRMAHLPDLLGTPQPPDYSFQVGHSVEFSFAGTVGTTFVQRFRINQEGDLFCAGNKAGYVVDHFINRVGDTLEQGDIVVIGSTDTSQYSGTDNNIPLLEADLTEEAYDSRVCGIVASVVTENDLPYAEVQAPDVEDIAREANTTQNALRRAVELVVDPFELEGTGSGGRVVVADVETAAEESEASGMGKLAERLGAYLNPLAQFAGEVIPESDATKVEDQQMGKMVTLGAFAHCKVDADVAPISAGDLLTTSSTRRHAQKVLEPQKAAGAIVGKALASLDGGRGKIPVLVMLQ